MISNKMSNRIMNLCVAVAEIAELVMIEGDDCLWTLDDIDFWVEEANSELS